MTATRISEVARETLHRIGGTPTHVSALARETLRSPPIRTFNIYMASTEAADTVLFAFIRSFTADLTATEAGDTVAGAIEISLGVTMDATEPNDAFVVGNGSGVISSLPDSEFIYVEPEVRVFLVPGYPDRLPFIIANDPNMRVDFEDRVFRVPAEGRTMTVPPIDFEGD